MTTIAPLQPGAEKQLTSQFKRIGVIGDGACYFHCICAAHSKFKSEYNNLRTLREKGIFASNLRHAIVDDSVCFEQWCNTNEANVLLQQKIHDHCKLDTAHEDKDALFAKTCAEIEASRGRDRRRVFLKCFEKYYGTQFAVDVVLPTFKVVFDEYVASLKNSFVDAYMLRLLESWFKRSILIVNADTMRFYENYDFKHLPFKICILILYLPSSNHYELISDIADDATEFRSTDILMFFTK